MADFCHEFDPGGLGCPHPGPCKDQCLGDFETKALALAPNLREGRMVCLGICEGHGCNVWLVHADDGVFVEHRGDISNEHATEPPKRIRVTK